MDQATARQQAIAAGASPADVDAFIAKEGGDRVSAQRITSAFNVSGSTGTDNLDAFHAQKAAAPSATYHSGAAPGDPTTAPVGPSMPGGGSGTPGGGTVPDNPAPSNGASALAGLSGLSGSLAEATAQQGQGQPQEAAGSGLRQSLGSRLYPTNTAALAGLQRAY